jgi:serine protease AprX
VPSGALSALAAAPCVAEVTPDSPVQLASIGGYDPSTDVGSLFSTEQILGAQAAWQSGATGQGVGVALIDTGVAPVAGLNGPGQVTNGPDLSFDSQVPQLTYKDVFGHGTHMAGIIGGNDAYGTGSHYAGDTSHFFGVAPDAHILNIKVFDENGLADVSQVIAGIDWAVAHRNDPGLNIRVINLSFGTNSSQAYTLDPLAFSAEVAWRSGIVVVAAVGNNGPASGGVSDPAYDPYLLAVGAADTQNTLSTADDTVAHFSSVGNGARNPDLVAPGVHIASLRDPGSFIDLNYGAGATVASRFFRGSGSSMATAVVSGAAAVYLSAHPMATPDLVKYVFTSTLTPLLGQPASAQGGGELNLGAALNASTPLHLAQQTYPPSTGTGSLEASRGGVHLTAGGVALDGDRDIFGNAWNAASIAQATLNGVAWVGGTFNGAGWSGAGWSGAGWSGAGWSGAGWSGAGWSGAGWSGAGWSGAGWSGAGWSGAGWS